MRKTAYLLSLTFHLLALLLLCQISTRGRSSLPMPFVDIVYGDSQGASTKKVTIQKPPKPLRKKVRTLADETSDTVLNTEPPPEPPRAQSNQVQGGSNGSAGTGEAVVASSGTRGVRVVYAPLPKLPEAFASAALKTNVVIEFTVLADSTNLARLVESSGNEELDAAALSATKRWKFLPAVADNRPMDTKIRLTVNFIVD